MPIANEPRNGDFVAYLEELQRESAARLLAQSQASMVQHHPGQAHIDNAPAQPEPTALTRRQADQLLARLASHRSAGRLLGPAIGLLIGLAMLLNWIAGGAGFLTLAIGVALVIWSIRRLRHAASERTASPRATAQALVSEFFGKPPVA